MHVHLITGGARSGKSRYAERLASACAERVTYIATATADDAEMRARIEQHRRRRPPTWITMEASRDAASAVLHAATPIVLLDCLTILAANAFLAAPDDIDAARSAVHTEVTALVDVAARRDGELIVVTNEVGSGIVPDSTYGRWFRDLLGEANCMVAERAERVTVVVAGYGLLLKDRSGRI